MCRYSTAQRSHAHRKRTHRRPLHCVVASVLIPLTCTQSEATLSIFSSCLFQSIGEEHGLHGLFSSSLCASEDVNVVFNWADHSSFLNLVKMLCARSDFQLSGHPVHREPLQCPSAEEDGPVSGGNPRRQTGPGQHQSWRHRPAAVPGNSAGQNPGQGSVLDSLWGGTRVHRLWSEVQLRSSSSSSWRLSSASTKTQKLRNQM